MSVLKVKFFQSKNFLLLIFLILLFFIYSLISTFLRPLHLSQDLNYIVSPHETMTVFIDDLAMRGIIQYPQEAILLSEIFGYSTRLQSGDYLINSNMTLKELLLLLSEHRVHYYSVTIVDGWTFSMLMQHLAANPYIFHDINYVNNLNLMKQLSGKRESPEGEFLAQTYFVTLGGSEYDILDRAYQAMQKKLKIDWDNRQTGLALRNTTQALVLASLIEEESKKKSDMPVIASVFYNRLHRGMPLQSDPTVLYAVNKPYGSHISHRNLKSHSPFNTYTHEGLPPTPIGLPGQDALWAALHPDRSGYYYFEAGGQGGLMFSKNLKGQERAIARYNSSVVPAKAGTQ